MKPVQALITTLTILTTALTAGHVNAGSIENLERERTILVGNLLTPEITAEERQAKLSVSQRRLIDLERVVLRDKSLIGLNTLAVKRAFANYDLTFLVHASVEKSRSLADHWLEQLAITQQTILGAVRRRR